MTERLWENRGRGIAEHERPLAEAAFGRALKKLRGIMAECETP
jgi:hypothetical protein